MLTLEKKINALKAFSFKDEAHAIVEANKDELDELQRRQLYSGSDANGKKLKLLDNAGIGFGYRDYTVRQKKLKGQPFGVVTWKDTGELYSTLHPVIRKDTFSITSDNFKFNIMLKRSGEDATGLDYSSRKEFIERFVRPGMLEVYRRKVKNI